MSQEKAGLRASEPRGESAERDMGRDLGSDAKASRVIAVDWSGKRKTAGDFIWRAIAVDGKLEYLEDGLDQEATFKWLVGEADEDPHFVAGLDFAFSFPEWFCRHHRCRDVRDVWALAGRHQDEWLGAVTPEPFWGRTTGNPGLAGSRQFRLTDREGGERSPKSVFQVGGAGHVGTGSIRGMPLLASLPPNFSVWPFDEPGWPKVVEIYPRFLYPLVLGTSSVKKSRRRDRAGHLEGVAGLSEVQRERAACSEDAFDAAISALAMIRHVEELSRLEADPTYAIEGRIWRPRTEPEAPGG